MQGKQYALPLKVGKGHRNEGSAARWWCMDKHIVEHIGTGIPVVITTYRQYIGINGMYTDRR